MQCFAHIHSTNLSDHIVDIRTSGIQEHREESSRNVEYPADIAVCGYHVRSSFYIISIYIYLAYLDIPFVLAKVCSVHDVGSF